MIERMYQPRSLATDLLHFANGGYPTRLIDPHKARPVAIPDPISGCPSTVRVHFSDDRRGNYGFEVEAKVHPSTT